MTLAIVDLGCGNIGSLRRAFERLGQEASVTSDAAEIAEADRVVLPGVGAAGFAMEQIDALGLRSTIVNLRQPVLGVCLGMQLMCEASEEENVDCLGIIEGKVRAMSPSPGYPVPHMGWARVHDIDADIGITHGDYLYFAHSFALDPGDTTIARADHDRPISAVVRKDNFTGAQFHPERSGAAGKRFLEAFLA